ncbi:MAG: HNH endonuclease [Gammaproteobacteria bacterium]
MQKKNNLKKQNPFEYRAKALRIAYAKLGHKLSIEQVREMMHANSRCYYCGFDLNANPLEYGIDHKTPKNKGGTNDMGNLVLCCRKCNSVKGTLTDTQYIDLLAYLKDKPEVFENLYKRLRMSGMVFSMMYKKK